MVRKILTRTFSNWMEDEAFRLSASLAYYAIFSMAPALIVIVAIVNAVYAGNQESQIEAYMSQYVGADAAATVTQAMRTMSERSGSGLIAGIVALGGILIGSSLVFAELKSAMNRIWNIEVTASGVSSVLWNRLTGFLIVVGIATLLIISMLVTAGISLYRDFLSRTVPGADYVWPYLDSLISLAVLTVLFAALYKYVPDAFIEWRDVWTGAIVTAVLFTAGKYAISWYLSTGGVQSAYGAAGTLLAILAFVYYSALIFFLGAEFTQAYAEDRGRPVTPKPYASHRATGSALRPAA